MVKVTKWDKKKKKEDWVKYRAEIKSRKYGVWQNMIYILREIWSIDKTMFFAVFCLRCAFTLQDCVQLLRINTLLSLRRQASETQPCL